MPPRDSNWVKTLNCALLGESGHSFRLQVILKNLDNAIPGIRGFVRIKE
jgi:hypothetical protein